MKEVINYVAAQLAKVAMVTGIVAGITIPALATNAQTPGICTFGDERGLRQIVVNGNTATATFTIPNGVNNSCARDGALAYSLVVYTAPDNTLRPLSAQRLFSSGTHNFTPGTHTLNATVPNCGFYQIDLVKGGVIANLNDSGNSYAPMGRLITAIGGGSACAAPAQPAAPAAPAAPAQTTVINNSNTNTNINQNQQQQQQAGSGASNGTQSQAQAASAASAASGSGASAAQAQAQAQTPATAVATPVATEVAVGKGLPNTGPGSTVAAFLGVSSISGLAYNLVMRRRGLSV